jgi:hypothetical protein
MYKHTDIVLASTVGRGKQDFLTNARPFAHATQVQSRIDSYNAAALSTTPPVPLKLFQDIDGRRRYLVADYQFYPPNAEPNGYDYGFDSQANPSGKYVKVDGVARQYEDTGES